MKPDPSNPHDPFGPQGNPFGTPDNTSGSQKDSPGLANDPFGGLKDFPGGPLTPPPTAPDPFSAPAAPTQPFGSPTYGTAFASAYPPPVSDPFADFLTPGGPPVSGPSPNLSPLGPPPSGHDPFGPAPSGLPPYSTAAMTSGAFAGASFGGQGFSAQPSLAPGPSDFDFATPPPATAGPGKLRHSRDEQVEKAFEIAALNPLVAVAAPLLWLAARLHESMPPDDMRLFRDRVLEEVRLFETTAMARGIAPRSVRIARYLLCATIDDVLLNTNWGSQSNWASAALVSSLYSETIGGERFFDLLSQLHAAPDDNVELLELIALCLSIGFAGKYRVAPGGQGQLNRLRSELYRTLRQVRGPYDRTLAPPWEIVAAPHRAPPRMFPLWLIIAAALAILIGVYSTFAIVVGNHLTAATDRLAALVPTVPVLVEKPPIPAIPQPRRPPPPPPPPPPPVRLTQVERVSALLKQDITERRVEVIGSPETVTVRLLNVSFPSSRATLSSAETPLMTRVAAALDKEPGAIRVIGHTDNVAIGATSAFANNQELSEKRAESAAQMLKRFLSSPDRVTSEGRGATKPVASNATAEGRTQNRRVEVEIPAENIR